MAHLCKPSLACVVEVSPRTGRARTLQTERRAVRNEDLSQKVHGKNPSEQRTSARGDPALSNWRGTARRRDLCAPAARSSGVAETSASIACVLTDDGGSGSGQGSKNNSTKKGRLRPYIRRPRQSCLHAVSSHACNLALSAAPVCTQWAVSDLAVCTSTG